MTGRREFLMLAGTAVGAAAAVQGGGRLIDCHVHLFLPEFAYHANASYRPAAHPLADYLKFLRESPIDHAVVVHPEPYQDDHRILEYIFRNEPSPGFFKATCLFDPIDPATPKRMAELARAHPERIVGIRIHETHKPGTPPAVTGPIKDRDFKDPGMRNVLAAARELKMVVQFHLIPYYAGQVGELARQFPEVSIVLDHLARANEGSRADVDTAMKLSKLGNVYMKYSGPYAGDAALVERAFDSFGPDRMVCGYAGMDAKEFKKWNDNFYRVFAKKSQIEVQKIRIETAKLLFQF